MDSKCERRVASWSFLARKAVGQGQKPLQARRTSASWTQLKYSILHGELYVVLSVPHTYVGRITGHGWHCLETHF